jgi:hypothetical protein
MKNVKILLTLLLLITGCKKEHVPELITIDVSSIGQTSAICGGEITSQGSSEIMKKGICWSTSIDPTIQDSITNEGTGLGNFTSNLTGLDPNTKYFVRAYATNSNGTGYGKTKSFTTEPASVPEVKTYYPFSIRWTTVKSGGEITSDGASPIIDCGVCWSTSENPSLSDNAISAGTGSAVFTSTITGLESNTTYYIRAYATNFIGTGYGSSVSFTTCLDLNSNPVNPSSITLWDKPLDTIRKYIEGKWRIVVVGGGFGGGWDCYNNFFSEFTEDNMFISNTFSLKTDTNTIKWEKKLYYNSPNPDSTYIMTLIRSGVPTGSSYAIEKILYDTLVYYQYPDIDASYFYGIKYK